MSLKEIVPAIRGAIWSRLYAFLFENVANCLTTDLLDAELTKFTDDACVAEARGLGDLANQLPNVSRFALTAFRVLGLRLALFVTQPAIERAGRDNRNQFFDGSTNRLFILDQAFSLLGLRVNLTGRPRRIAVAAQWNQRLERAVQAVVCRPCQRSVRELVTTKRNARKIWTVRRTRPVSVPSRKPLL